MKFDRKAYRNFNFYASQSPKADIPLSLFRWDRDGGTPTPALDFDATDKSISFFDNTACRGHTYAASWVQTFNDKAILASYGNCIPTTPIPPGLSLQNEADRKMLLQKHLFNFVADHTAADEFACGVIWEALHAGTIPVYFGPNNISQYVPPHSIISASEIGTKKRTAELIMEIASNRTLWETYHAWRKQPFPSHLKRHLELVPTEPLLCRICKWAYAKRYGLAWNPTTQRVQMPVIARDYVCQSADGFVMQPFRESWIFSSSSSSRNDVTLADTGVRCADSTNSTQVFQSDGLFSLTRTVSQHDTIVDFIIPEIKSQKGNVVLRLEVGIENWDGSHFRDVHQSIASHHVSFHSSVAIQDRFSRMTVLANWPTQLRSPARGIIEVVVLGPDEESLLMNEVRQIRILLEDISSLRDVKTEYGATPFAKPLMQDFLDPLELYFVTPS
ncbi:alpha-(1-_3)-fucosyltransferase [Fragilaria crotonensis]|nr:alpha-(1->3)-fucosyltransferase [Fragilaria crotonensis]